MENEQKQPEEILMDRAREIYTENHRIHFDRPDDAERALSVKVAKLEARVKELEG